MFVYSKITLFQHHMETTEELSSADEALHTSSHSCSDHKTGLKFVVINLIQFGSDMKLVAGSTPAQSLESVDCQPLSKAASLCPYMNK